MAGKKTPPTTNALTALGARIDGAYKKIKKPTPVVTMEDVKSALPHLPTGSIIIDFLIGGRPNRYGIAPCPGFPREKIISLYGKEGSGKTTIALTVAATTIRNGGTVCFIDWENAIVPYYAESLGVPVKDATKFMLCQPDTLEEGVAIANQAAQLGVDLVIFDSVGAGIPKAQLEQTMEETSDGKVAQIGYAARTWSQNLSKLQSIISAHGACVLAIHQLRMNIGKKGYGPDTTAVGGEAWKYYAALRIMLRRAKTDKAKVYNPMTHKNEEQPVGGVIRVRLDKCKLTANQGWEAEFYIRQGSGIDDVRSIIDIAQRHGIVKKSGAWYGWERGKGDEIRGQGADNFQAALLASKGGWSELYKLTLDKLMNASGDNIPIPEDDDFEDLDAFISGGGD